ESDISTIQNAIAGITKKGSGTLKLLGNNSYPNTTTVSAGTLVVNGNNGPSNFLVSSGGTLRGTGTIAALTVNNGGTVKPGDGGPGVLSVAGNALFSSGSTFAPDIFGSAIGQFGQLKVTGTVTLN